MKSALLTLFTIALALASPWVCLSSAHATSVPPRKLTDLVAEADHILVAKIEKVEMLDGNGKELTNLEARTGPGNPNLMRLHLVVVPDGILKSQGKTAPPARLIVPLWQMWHYTLGQWKAEEGKTLIFLLKGNEFQRVDPAGFLQPLTAQAEIVKLIAKGSSTKK